jgi:hypothetical protein
LFSSARSISSILKRGVLAAGVVASPYVSINNRTESLLSLGVHLLEATTLQRLLCNPSTH